MYNIRYCIPCERGVWTGDKDYHVVFGTLECGCIDIDHECSGPFTETEPPSLPEDWELQLIEPSDEELESTNANADELILSLEGE